MKSYLLNLKPWQHDRLKKVSAHEGIPISQILRIIVTEWLDSYDYQQARQNGFSSSPAARNTDLI